MDIRVIVYRTKNISADDPTISISFSRREKFLPLKEKYFSRGLPFNPHSFELLPLFQYTTMDFRAISFSIGHFSPPGTALKRKLHFFQSPCGNRPFTRFMKSKIGFSLNFRQTFPSTIPSPSTSSRSVPTEPHRSTGAPIRRAADKKRTAPLGNRPSFSAHARVRAPRRLKSGRRVLPDERAPRSEPRRERRGSRDRSRRSRP